MKKSNLFVLGFSLLLAFVMVGTAWAKSMYVAADHHNKRFQSWTVAADGTVAYDATYILQHSTDPSGIAIDCIPKDSPTMFITSEFSGGVEMINPITLQYMGVSSGPRNLAGIDVNDEDDIVFTLYRNSRTLYIYSFDVSIPSITQQAVIYLPGLSAGYGLALDDQRNVLWVTDTNNSRVRAYDVNVSNWNDIAEIPGLSTSQLSQRPIDVAVDRYRNIVYTVGGWYGAQLLSKYDVETGVENVTNMGTGGIGCTVDEITGYVYVTTGGRYGSGGGVIQVWDCSTSPFTLVQSTGNVGNPAGIAIPQREISRNPLNLAKNGIIQGTGISIGSHFTYEIAFDNLANSSDATDVTITDIMPDELDFISSAVDGVAGDGTEYDSSTHTVLWDVGTIAAGEQGPDIELMVRVNDLANPGSTIYNHALIDYTLDGEPGQTDVVDQDPDDPSDEPGIETYPCGDLDHDGDVDGDDRSIFRSALRTCEGDPGFVAEADYDGDGCITYNDYREWYKCYKAFNAPT